MKHSITSREFIDQPHHVVRRRKRMTKKQKAQAAAKRRACGTATSSKSAAGIKGRRAPRGIILIAGPQSIQPLELTIAAMTPKGLPEPHRYRIG